MSGAKLCHARGTETRVLGESRKMNDEHKSYLGDSVYADFDGYHIVLTTENGYGPSNTIRLEPEVYSALVAYQKQVSRSEESRP